MRLVLLLCEGTSHLKHVHVVVASVDTVGTHVEVFSKDGLDRVPTVVDVARGTPGARHVLHPSAWISPPARIHPHVSPSCVLNSFGDGSIALLLVEHELIDIVIV